METEIDFKTSELEEKNKFKSIIIENHGKKHEVSISFFPSFFSVVVFFYVFLCYFGDHK